MVLHRDDMGSTKTGMSREMRFQEAVSTLKLTLDIVDVVGRVVGLKRAGKSFIGLCPFHKERTPSFNVIPHKQIFKCFGCGEGGDAFAFLMKHENKGFGQIVEQLAEAEGITIIRDNQTREQRSELDTIITMHQQAQTFFEQQLGKSDTVQAYLDNRGIGLAWQAAYGFGYAPEGWDNLYKELTRLLPTLASQSGLLERSGLFNKKPEGQSVYDRFRNRLMIPIHDDRGRIVAFGARALAAEDNPKYLNSPETELYVKNRILYGLYQAKNAIRDTGEVLIMEGYFDVISAHMAGFGQAVGVCGTALSEQHLKLLSRAGAKTLYLCFDSDKAGVNAAMRAIELIQAQILDTALSVKVIQIPGDKDPDDYLKHHPKADFEALMAAAPDFMTYKLTQTLSTISGPTNTPQGRIQAVQAVTPVLVGISQPVIRHEYLKWVAEYIGVDEESLLLEIKRAENQSNSLPYKKSFGERAIPSSPMSYLEGDALDRRLSPTPRLDDTTAFRKSIASRIPLEEKEHRLLSYLLLNEESYALVMDTLKDMTLHSPLAQSLLDAIKELEGSWQSVDDLVGQLQLQFLSDSQDSERKLLNHCLALSDDILAALEHSGKGLKSVGAREKLERDVADIVNKIHYQAEKAQLAELAQTVREYQPRVGNLHNGIDDDTLAQDAQAALREALELKRRALRPPAGDSPATTDLHHAISEQQQGV